MNLNKRENTEMKKLIISLLINISLTFTQDTHFIGGFTISTADGGDIEDVENIKGFRVGIENTKLSDYVTGVAYTQRGFVVDGFGKELEYKLNFLTAYVYKPVYKFSPQLDLVVGGEMGVFSNGNIDNDNNEDENINLEDWSEMGGHINLEDWNEMGGHLLNYGLLLGGRYYIDEKLSLVGTYYWALTEFWSDVDLTSRSIQIYIKF